MSKIITIAKAFWAKALITPMLSNILMALGIYALEQLISHLRKRKEEYYHPSQFIEMGV